MFVYDECFKPEVFQRKTIKLGNHSSKQYQCGDNQNLGFECSGQASSENEEIYCFYIQTVPFIL